MSKTQEPKASIDEIVATYATRAIAARIAQGLPATIQDPAVLRTIEAALRPTHTSTGREHNEAA